MEFASSMWELIENLVNFYNVLEKMADTASIVYQHEVLADRLHWLEKDHMDMLNQLHKYVNSLSNVNSVPSFLHDSLVNWPETINHIQ